MKLMSIEAMVICGLAVLLVIAWGINLFLKMKLRAQSRDRQSYVDGQDIEHG